MSKFLSTREIVSQTISPFVIQTLIVCPISYRDGIPFAEIAQGLAKISKIFSRFVFSFLCASYLRDFKHVRQ